MIVLAFSVHRACGGHSGLLDTRSEHFLLGTLVCHVISLEEIRQISCSSFCKKTSLVAFSPGLALGIASLPTCCLFGRLEQQGNAEAIVLIVS